MDNMNLFNERKKKKDELELNDVEQIVKDIAKSALKSVTPLTFTADTREGRTEDFLRSLESTPKYKEPLEFLDQAFDLEQLLLLQSCLSISGQSLLHSKLDGLNSYKERELNFEARKKMKTLAPNIVMELLESVRKLEKTSEKYHSKDLYDDVCLVTSYRYMRYYVDCAENTKLEIKATKLGKVSVENNNGSAKVNANFSFGIPKLFEYV